jgi:hypothetical protein
MRNIESSEYLSEPSLGKVATTKDGSEFTLSAKQAGRTAEVVVPRSPGQRGKKAGVSP